MSTFGLVRINHQWRNLGQGHYIVNKNLWFNKIFYCLLLVIYPSVSQSNAHHQGILELSLKDLLAIEITGPTLTTESFKTVPASVTVFTRSQIQRLGFDTLPELIRLVPGFQSYASGQSSEHYPASVRGRRVGSFSQEILLLVDGHRLNEPKNGGIASILNRVPLHLINRVEFIRGPGAATYGSNAMLGVINIITVDNARQIELNVGSHNAFSINALSSNGINEFSIDTAVHYNQTNGDSLATKDFLTNEPLEVRDPSDLIDFHSKLRWKNSKLTIHLNRSHSSDFFSGDIASQYFDIHNRERSDYIQYHQDFSIRMIDSWLNLSFHEVEEKINRTVSPGGKIALQDFPLNIRSNGVYTEKSSEFRLHWHNSWLTTAFTSIQFGAEIRRVKSDENIIEYQDEGVSIRNVVQDASNRDIFGVYGQYQLELKNDSKIVLGARYDKFSEIDSELSPRVSWVKDITDNQIFKILYGQAFRAPSETEIYISNNTAVLGSKELQPEIVQTMDLIWQGQWESLGATINYFRNNFSASIEQTLNSNSELLYVNSDDKYRTCGVEFELIKQWNKNILFRATSTKIFKKSDNFFRESEKLASVHTNFSFAPYNLDISASYDGARPYQNSSGEIIELPAYWEIYLKSSLQVGKAEYYLKFKNLLDEDIQTPPAFSRIDTPIPNRGIEVFLGASYTLQ